MSRRNGSLITNYEEAVQWLSEFKHTVNDEPVLKILEILEEEASQENETKQDIIDNLNNVIDYLNEEIKCLKTRLNLIK